MKVYYLVPIFLLAITLFSCSHSEKYVFSTNMGPKTQKVLPKDYAKIFHVSMENGSNQAGNGSAEKPWRTLQYTLDQTKAAGSGNRYAVLVSHGDYDGETIQMKNHVDLFGGFDAGTWQRDIFKHRTVLMVGDGRRVIIVADDARLDGFVINKSQVRDKGAGLYCDGVSPVISNNVFIANKTLAPIPWNPKYLHETANDGGAIYCRNGASPVIENNIFANNTTECGRGAAIAFHGRCNGRIAHNVFFNNTTGLADPMRSSDGGAISIFDWSSPLIENNILLNNKALASNDAGGLFVALWSSPIIKQNIFVGNICGDDAGALFVGGQEHRYDRPLDPLPDKDAFFVEIDGNVFIGNSNSSRNSGAMRFTMESRGSFSNNIVAHNSGIYFQRCEVTVEKNIIMENFLFVETKAGLQPGVIRNNLIWGDFILETEASVLDNNIKRQITGNTSIMPGFRDDRIEIKVVSATYNPKQITTSMLVADDRFRQNELAGRIVKAGDQWGVVRSNSENNIEIWGDFFGCLEFTIIPTYRFK